MKMIFCLEFASNRRRSSLSTAGTAIIFGPTSQSLLKKSHLKEIGNPTHSPKRLNPMDMQLKVAIL